MNNHEDLVRHQFRDPKTGRRIFDLVGNYQEQTTYMELKSTRSMDEKIPLQFVQDAIDTFNKAFNTTS